MQEHNLSQSRPAEESEQGPLYEWITFSIVLLLYVPEVVKDLLVINCEQQTKQNICYDLKEVRFPNFLNCRFMRYSYLS